MRAVLREVPELFHFPLISSSSSMLSKFCLLVCPPTTTTLPSSLAILCLNRACTRSPDWVTCTRNGKIKGNALQQEVTCHVEGSILQVAAEALLLVILPPVTKICPLWRRQSAEEEIIGLDKVKLVHRQLVVSKTKLLFFSSPPTTANLVSEMATVQAYLAPAPGIFGPSLHARVSPTGRNSLDLESFLPPKMNVPTGRTTVWVHPSSLVSLALKFCQARSLNWKQLVGE